MINRIFTKLFYIYLLLFVFISSEAQIKTKIMQFELSELSVINNKNSFLKEVDSLILNSDCPRLNKHKFNNYSMSISKNSDSIFSVNVVLTINVRDSITDMGFFKRGKSLFIVRGINPDNLFFITKKKRIWMYKKQIGETVNELTPREILEGPAPTWYFEYYNNKLGLVKISNCSKSKEVLEK